MEKTESERLEERVTNEALNLMVGREFDMMDYLITKAMIRSELEGAKD